MKLESKVDFEELNRLINEWYELLYNDSAPVGAEDKRQAVSFIENFIYDNNNISFLKNLYNIRHDCLTSDREYQALYFSLIEMNLI